MMTRHEGSAVLSCALAMALTSGSVLAAGPMPYDGANAGVGSFTIDHVGFDAGNVEAAPCPTGAVCSNGSGTDGTGMLMREVAIGGIRYYQQVVADLDGAEGDFVMEAAVAATGQNDNYASKVRMQQGAGANAFFTEQTFQRGVRFNGTGVGLVNFGNTYFNVVQNVGGFQTFSMNSTANPGGNQISNGIIMGTVSISQLGGTRAGNFAHVVKEGTGVPIGGSLNIAGVGSLTYAPGNRISATAIGYTMYAGGPTATILAPGQDQDHNHRTEDQTDFGLLIYRAQTAPANGVGNGSSGGLSVLNGAQFSQSNLNLNELRAFSLHPDQASGEFYNVNHGSFVGGADLITDNWAPIFGPVPF